MVIGSERHESRRIDNQLRGRSGRQGDPGCSTFYVSFEDELMQRFASERIKQFSGYLEDEAIENKVITKTIENAQKRVEGQNFDVRKQLLQYDDIMRQQREIMYSERDAIMSENDLTDIVNGMFKQAVEHAVDKYTRKEDKGVSVDINGLLSYVGKNYMLLTTLEATNKETVVNDPAKIKNALSEIVAMQFENRLNKDLPPEIKLDFERRVLLGVIDRTWINHIS